MDTYIFTLSTSSPSRFGTLDFSILSSLPNLPSSPPPPTSSSILFLLFFEFELLLVFLLLDHLHESVAEVELRELRVFGPHNEGTDQKGEVQCDRDE